MVFHTYHTLFFHTIPLADGRDLSSSLPPRVSRRALLSKHFNLSIRSLYHLFSVVAVLSQRILWTVTPLVVRRPCGLVGVSNAIQLIGGRWDQPLSGPHRTGLRDEPFEGAAYSCSLLEGVLQPLMHPLGFAIVIALSISWSASSRADCGEYVKEHRSLSSS